MSETLTETDKLKTMLRLFPYLGDKNKVKALQIDDDSFYYISLREYADNITNIIKIHLNNMQINPKESIITDATAGVGGNTLSFSPHFKQVYAIEIDKKRSEFLTNNINVYNFNNVKVINADYVKQLKEIKQNVVFIDPPWGGKTYKNHKALRLHLSDIPIEDICNELLDTDTNLIVLKLPINYDIKYLYRNIKIKNIYFYNLKRMFILIIIND